MPRFKSNPKPKGVIGFGSNKTGAKRCLYAPVEQTRSQKRGQKFQKCHYSLRLWPRVAVNWGQIALYASVIN